MIQRVFFPFRGAELGGSHVATFALAGSLQQTFGVECLVICSPDTLIMDEARRLGFSVISSEETPTGRNNVVTDITRLERRRAILARNCSASPSIVSSLRVLA